MLSYSTGTSGSGAEVEKVRAATAHLTGLDIAALLKAHRANPAITIPEFLANHAEVHYRVLVPMQLLLHVR